MPYGYKFDRPPLLPPGRHPMSLAELRKLTVTGLPDGIDRGRMFDEFETLVADLERLRIPCEILCNGSFLTEANDPSDIDVVVRIDHDVVAEMSDEQAAFIEALNDDLEKRVIDTFAEVAYPRGHPNYGVEEGASWEASYGLEHSLKWLKGVAVVKLGETDVGLRLGR
jgi:predicted nucleotidyltransferase